MAVDEWANGKLVLMDIYTRCTMYVYYKPSRKVRKRKYGIVLNDIAVRWNYLSPPIGYKVNSKSLMLTVRNALDLRPFTSPSSSSSHFVFFSPFSIVLLHEVLYACLFVCNIYKNVHAHCVCVCVCIHPVFQLNGVDLNCTVVTIFKQIFSIER